MPFNDSDPGPVYICFEHALVLPGRLDRLIFQRWFHGRELFVGFAGGDRCQRSEHRPKFGFKKRIARVEGRTDIGIKPSQAGSALASAFY